MASGRRRENREYLVSQVTTIGWLFAPTTERKVLAFIETGSTSVTNYRDPALESAIEAEIKRQKNGK